MLNLLPVIVSPLLYMQLLIVSHMIMFILTAYMCWYLIHGHYCTYAVYKPFDITKVMATIYFCCQNNSFVKCLRDLIFMLGSNAQHQLIQLIFVCTSLFSRIVWKLMLRKIFVFYGMWPMLMPLYCLWCLVVTCTNMMLSCAVLFCTERSYLSQSSWLKQWLYSAWDF